jgi:Metal-independent alpha-mannosidase (GH125)
MSWSGFRPSDDPQQFGYNIPVNMYAVGALERALLLNRAVWHNPALGEKAASLAQTIQLGIEKFGVISVDNVRVYAYEVGCLLLPLHTPPAALPPAVLPPHARLQHSPLRCSPSMLPHPPAVLPLQRSPLLSSPCMLPHPAVLPLQRPPLRCSPIPLQCSACMLPPPPAMLPLHAPPFPCSAPPACSPALPPLRCLARDPVRCMSHLHSVMYESEAKHDVRVRIKA